jgi:hypothetical protein
MRNFSSLPWITPRKRTLLISVLEMPKQIECLVRSKHARPPESEAFGLTFRHACEEKQAPRQSPVRQPSRRSGSQKFRSVNIWFKLAPRSKNPPASEKVQARMNNLVVLVWKSPPGANLLTTNTHGPKSPRRWFIRGASVNLERCDVNGHVAQDQVSSSETGSQDRRPFKL